jgi:hypothetical protein
MTGKEYFFSPNGKTFVPLGESPSRDSARRKAQKLVNSKKRKFPVPLVGEQMLLAKRVMPGRNKKAKNKEEASPGRIKFLVAPLEITRDEEKIVLSVKGEFLPEDGHAKGL